MGLLLKGFGWKVDDSLGAFGVLLALVCWMLLDVWGYELHVFDWKNFETP